MTFDDPDFPREQIRYSICSNQKPKSGDCGYVDTGLTRIVSTESLIERWSYDSLDLLDSPLYFYNPRIPFWHIYENFDPTPRTPQVVPVYLWVGEE